MKQLGIIYAILISTTLVTTNKVTSVEVGDENIVVINVEEFTIPLKLSLKDAKDLALKLMVASEGRIHYAFAMELEKNSSFKKARFWRVEGGEQWDKKQDLIPYGKLETICLSTFPKGVRDIAEANLTEIECWKKAAKDGLNYDQYIIHGKGIDDHYYLMTYAVPPRE